MSAPARHPTLPQAPNACESCKGKKRKCDRLLPSCSLCDRTRRSCSYGGSSNPPLGLVEVLGSYTFGVHSHGGSRQSSSFVCDLAPEVSPFNDDSSLLSTPAVPRLSCFPSAAFLDVDYYKWAGMQLPKPVVEIPVVSVLTVDPFLWSVRAWTD